MINFRNKSGRVQNAYLFRDVLLYKDEEFMWFNFEPIEGNYFMGIWVE